MKTPVLVAALLLVCAASVAPAQKTPKPKPKPKPAPQKPVAKVTIEVLHSEGGKLTAVKAGDKLMGERTFRIRVQASDPISTVEFYVGEDLRETDGSTPYEFKLDALSEEEGPIKLTFKGYTSRGTSATKTLNLVVDNGGGATAEEHVQRGRDSLANGQADAAIDSGRIALKIDPNSTPAKLLLARAYLTKGQFDRAQNLAEGVVTADPNNSEARELVGAIGVQRAFRVMAGGSGDRAETLKTYGEALGLAAEARAKVDEARFDALPADAATKDPAGYADVAFEAGRYTAAIAALRPAYEANTADTNLGNRLAFAYLMASDAKGLSDTLALIRRYGKFDAYTYALEGLAKGEAGDAAGADESFKNGALENADSLGLRTAQASLLLKRNRPADRTALEAVSAALAREAASQPEVNFYRAAVANRLQNYNESRTNFESAVRIDPANADMYIEQGSQALGLAYNSSIAATDRTYYLDSARTHFEVALKAKPNSPYAFAGLAIVAMEQGKTADAVRNAELATRAGENVAIGYFVLSGALSLERKALLSRYSNLPAGAEKDALRAQEAEIATRLTASLRRSAELDQPNLYGRTVPDAEAAYRYLSSAGRAPVLTPPARG